MRCAICANSTELVDRQGRCERCVMDGDDWAASLQDIDSEIEVALARGLSPNLIREAVEMALRNESGPIAGGRISRDPAADLSQGGVWDVYPRSEFLDLDVPCVDPSYSALRGLRLASHRTLEELASELGESVATVGSWEQGVVEIPDEPARRLARAFGVRPEHLLRGGC